MKRLAHLEHGDLRDLNYVKLIVDKINSAENVKRKEDSKKLSEVCNKGVKELVRKEFRKKYPKNWKKYNITDISLGKKVRDKLSKAYKETPQRQMVSEDNTKVNDDVSSDYSKIINRADLNGEAAVFDQIFNTHKYALMWFKYVSENDIYICDALEPHEYDLFADVDLKELTAFAITKELDIDGTTYKQYSIWNEFQFCKVITESANTSDGIDYYGMEGNKEFVNPHETIPVAYVAQGKKVGYPEQSNLGEQSIEWALGYSDLKTSASDQAHSNLVVEHDEDVVVDGLTPYDKKTFIDLEQPADSEQHGTKSKPSKAYYINANPKLSEHERIVLGEGAEYLSEHGIKSNSAMNGAKTVEAGISKIIDDADVQGKINENQNTYIHKLEQRAFEIISQTTEGLGDYRYRNLRLRVSFPKPKVLLSDTDTLDIIEKREKLELDLPWKKHQIADPNMTDEEAKKLYEEIQEHKRKKAKEDPEKDNKKTEDKE